MGEKKSEGVSPAALSALLDGNLKNFAAASVPGGIEAMEAAGQAELVRKPDRLPVHGTIDRADLRAQWEAAGFVFGDPLPEPEQRGRVVFVACTFPDGWGLRPTGHSMWSDVTDARGRPRAQVFFKAAFYDYNAHTFGLQPRYRHGVRYDDSGSGCTAGIVDTATGDLIHTFARCADYTAMYAGGDFRDIGVAWLDVHYPDHTNPLAYWD